MKYTFRRRTQSFAIAFCLSCPLTATAKTDQNEEMAVLKEELSMVQEQIEEINQNASKRMSISGYSDLEVQKSTEAGNHPGYRLHHLSLFFEKRIEEKWKFFSEIEYEDAPKFEGAGEPQTGQASGEIIEDAKGKLFVEAVNITYQHDAGLNLRGGRFFTPAGIWSVDHYPSFVPTQLRPQHIRNIFPQVVDGVVVYGSTGLGATFIDYHVYTGNGEGNTGAKDLNSEKATGFRVAAILPWLNYFEIGASSYRDVLNDDTEKSAIGAHVKLEFSDFAIQSEFAKGQYSLTDGTRYASKGYYAQALYRPNALSYGVRHDYFLADDRDNSSGKTYDGVFVNYRINDSVLLKLEHHLVNNDDGSISSHTESICSLVVYLGN